jgi:hypothetical protein
MRSVLIRHHFGASPHYLPARAGRCLPPEQSTNPLGHNLCRCRQENPDRVFLQTTAAYDLPQPPYPNNAERQFGHRPLANVRPVRIVHSEVTPARNQHVVICECLSHSTLGILQEKGGAIQVSNQLMHVEDSLAPSLTIAVYRCRRSPANA